MQEIVELISYLSVYDLGSSLKLSVNNKSLLLL
jgi:hypothetical protein